MGRVWCSCDPAAVLGRIVWLSLLRLGRRSSAGGAESRGGPGREFDFPDFYGRNWSAFWDAVSGLVFIPEHVRFMGWELLAERVPGGAMMLTHSLDHYRDLYRPGLRVEYL